jgi:hypothetical protein
MFQIHNIEIFGFGTEDAYNSLIKKQNQDKVIKDKMKKCDRAAFVENEFNKDMFFEQTFNHQNYEKKSDV